MSRKTLDICSSFSSNFTLGSSSTLSFETEGKEPVGAGAGFVAGGVPELVEGAEELGTTAVEPAGLGVTDGFPGDGKRIPWDQDLWAKTSPAKEVNIINKCIFMLFCHPYYETSLN
jgi:hypothetical protein